MWGETSEAIINLQPLEIFRWSLHMTYTSDFVKKPVEWINLSDPSAMWGETSEGIVKGISK